MQLVLYSKRIAPMHTTCIAVNMTMQILLICYSCTVLKFTHTPPLELESPACFLRLHQIAANKRYAGNAGFTVSEVAAKVQKDFGNIDILVRAHLIILLCQCRHACLCCHESEICCQCISSVCA